MATLQLLQGIRVTLMERVTVVIVLTEHCLSQCALVRTVYRGGRTFIVWGRLEVVVGNATIVQNQQVISHLRYYLRTFLVLICLTTLVRTFGLILQGILLSRFRACHLLKLTVGFLFRTANTHNI